MRRFLRLTFWALAALAVLALVGYTVLRSRAVEERVRVELEAFLTDRFEREVAIGHLEFGLLPIEVRARDLRVAGVNPESPPSVEVERVRVRLDIEKLRPLQISVSEIVAVAPVLRVHVTEGGDDFPRWHSRGDRRETEVRLGRLAVQQGEFHLDDRRWPLEFDARGLRGRGFGGEGLEVQGRLAFEEVRVELPEGRELRGALGLRVRVFDGHVGIQHARFSSPDVAAIVSGEIGWRAPATVDLDIVADSRGRLLYELGYLADPEAFRGGFRFAGGYVWRSEAWGLRGRVSAPRVSLAGRTVSSVRGVLSTDRNGLRLDLEHGVYSGGSLSGVVVWDPDRELRPVEVALDIEGWDLLRTLNETGIPIGAVSSRISGALSYGFAPDDPMAGEGWAEMRIEPRRSGAGLRASGTATLVVRNGELSAESLRLASNAQRIAATGRYDLTTGDGWFEIGIDSSDLGRLLPVVPGLENVHVERPLWAPLEGAGTADVDLRLESGGVEVDVDADLRDVRGPGIAADRASGRFSVSADRVHGLDLQFHRAEAGLSVRGDFPFEATAADPFGVSIESEGWQVADLRAWLPFEPPAEGPLFGTATLGGTYEEILGGATLDVRPASAGGIGLDALSLDLELGAEAVTFRRIAAIMPAGSLTAVGDYGLTSEELDLELASAGLRLGAAPFEDVLPGLGGELTLAGRVSGPIESPRLEADLVSPDLFLLSADGPGRSLGAASVRFRTLDGRLEADGDLAGLVTFAGGGPWAPEEADLRFEVASTKLAELAAVASDAEFPDFDGSFDGAVFIVSSGEGTRVAMSLDSLRVALETAAGRRRFENLESVEMVLDEEGLQIESLFLGEETGGEIFVGGTVRFGDEPELALQLQASASAEWLAPFLPGFTVRGGTFDALSTIGGTLEQPELNGQGAVSGARILFEGAPSVFDRASAVVLLYPRQIVIDTAEAAFAGGRVIASGSIDLTEDAAGVARFQARGTDLTLRYPEGWLLRGGGELSLISDSAGRQVRGAVRLDRALYTEDVPVGLTSLLEGFFARRRVELDETDEELAATNLNVSVVGPEALRVRNNVADLRGSLDLLLRGNLARPVVFGTVEVDAGGTLLYSGTEYTVQRGVLTFANPFRVEPVIDLLATTELREYDVTLDLSGTLDRLDASFASDPPLADLEVLSLVATGGRVIDPSGTAGVASTGAGSAVGAEAFLYGQATSAIADRVNRLFGLDKFRVDPLTGDSGNLSSARVTVGERLSRDLFATYSYDPSQTEQQILQVEWTLTPTFTLVATQNGDGTYALDGRWEKRF